MDLAARFAKVTSSNIATIDTLEVLITVYIMAAILTVDRTN